jgi:hypothetical protein
LACNIGRRRCGAGLNKLCVNKSLVHVERHFPKLKIKRLLEDI